MRRRTYCRQLAARPAVTSALSATSKQHARVSIPFLAIKQKLIERISSCVRRYSRCGSSAHPTTPLGRIVGRKLLSPPGPLARNPFSLAAAAGSPKFDLRHFRGETARTVNIGLVKEPRQTPPRGNASVTQAYVIARTYVVYAYRVHACFSTYSRVSCLHAHVRCRRHGPCLQ